MSERWGEIDDMDLRQMEAEMRDELADFRTAATRFAERSRERSADLPAAVAPHGTPWFRWAGAGVVAALLVGGGLRAIHHTGAAAPASGAAVAEHVRQVDAVSDEALLSQVQSDLATGVPTAMQPLAVSSGQSARATERHAE